MKFGFSDWACRKIHRGLNAFSLSRVSFRSWSVVFFGSDYYSLHSLTMLCKQVECKLISKIEVVTTHENTPTYKFATGKNIKVHLWPPSLSGTYDFGIIVSFGKFIPKKILDQFPLGIINVHASLLPRWRGGLPIVHTLKNGDTTTGVTVIRINSDKFDTGEIVLQRSCSIGRNELLPSLHKKLKKLGSECLTEVIDSMPQCLENCVPQPNTNVSYAPILKKEVGVVKWNKMTAVEVYNLFRALYGLFKLKTSLNGKSVELVCLSLIDSSECSFSTKGETLLPGTVIFDNKNQYLMVQCKDNFIKLCTVSVGGKLYNSQSFYIGFGNTKSCLKFDSLEV